MIVQALLVASLWGQRSSSSSTPFDNPFWVEWLRGQRRPGQPTASLLVGPNGDGLQQQTQSSHQVFGDYSTETVPLLQPLFSRDNKDKIEKGKVFTPAIQTQLASGYINEHESDGQLEVQQRSHRKVPSINGKSAVKTNSIQSDTFAISAADAQSDVSQNKLRVKNINHEDTYLEESRSSSNLLPINILQSNDFVWSSNPNSPSQLSTSTFSENKQLDENAFAIGNDDIIIDDTLNYNLITSTLKPLTISRAQAGLQSREFQPIFSQGSFISDTNQDTIGPITTTASSLAPTTSTTTASTTTRTLVASWPAIRSRNIGSARAENRFRKRVPLSSSRKSGRRNKITNRRRQNFKRRRQTITPQFRSTTSIPVTTILSTVPTITHNYDTTKTRVSRTPNLSTTTTTTTTTTVRITSTTTVTTTSSSTTLSTTTQTSTSTTTTQPTIAPTTSAATFVYTNLRTASALVVTRNVTSTRVVTAPIPEVTLSEEETTIPTTTEMTSTEKKVFPTTPTPFLQHEIIYNDESNSVHIENIPSSAPLKMSSDYEYERIEYTTQPETIDYESHEPEEKLIQLPSNINHVKVEDPGMRTPRLTDSDWVHPHIPEPIATEDIHSGAYHETNPGQYHEVNPGQYHEVNPGQPVALGEGLEVQSGQYHEKDPGQPVALAQKDGTEILSGQYHEVNPGQYHEVNPGQYHEVNPGQYVDDTLKSSDKSDHTVELVDVEHTDNAKIYNVQQRVNEFIIGEYGTITNSGQTLQGVRYTAVADDNSGVDPNFIYETLVKYFPMAAAKFAKSNPRAAS